MDPTARDLHLHKKVVHLHNGMQTWTFQKTFHYLWFIFNFKCYMDVIRVLVTRGFLGHLERRLNILDRYASLPVHLLRHLPSPLRSSAGWRKFIYNSIWLRDTDYNTNNNYTILTVVYCYDFFAWHSFMRSRTVWKSLYDWFPWRRSKDCRRDSLLTRLAGHTWTLSVSSPFPVLLIFCRLM